MTLFDFLKWLIERADMKVIQATQTAQTVIATATALPVGHPDAVIPVVQPEIVYQLRAPWEIIRIIGENIWYMTVIRGGTPIFVGHLVWIIVLITMAVIAYVIIAVLWACIKPVIDAFRSPGDRPASEWRGS